jgi:hypothetical protein
LNSFTKKIGEIFFLKIYLGQDWIDIYELDEEAYEESRFLMNRLLYFSTILWGYLWNDETLPCVED